MTLPARSHHALPAFLVCPECRSGLEVHGAEVACAAGHRFSFADGVLDFLPGARAVDAEWAGTRTEGERAHGRDAESDGIAHRIENYVLPFLASVHGRTRELRVLDDGTGLGHTVRLLRDHDVDAYGIDPGSRREEWAGSGFEDRLFSASGRRLPFADGSFDAVLSSGVLEHVGEELPADQREQACVEYVEEALRVLRPGGVALLAAPNGLHPIDFWHTGGKALRVHSPLEKWMPRPADLRRWVAASAVPGTVSFRSPRHYLAFQTIRRHAYGRAFSGAMRGLFATMDRLPVLARSPLNPWLVCEVRRPDDDVLGAA